MIDIIFRNLVFLHIQDITEHSIDHMYNSNIVFNLKEFFILKSYLRRSQVHIHENTLN